MLSLNPSAAPCTLHKYHSPRIYRTVQHHVIPEAWTTQVGQPQAPRVTICDTAHYAIHQVINALVFGGSISPYMPTAYRELAQEAADWWEENGKPPIHRTTEYPNVV
jgi:hypothetical protein